MAENLPDQTPAPDGGTATPPQVPEVKPADNQPAAQPAPSVTLTDDQKSYLKGQGLKDEDLNSPDAITKIISHAQSSQKAVSDYRKKLESAGLTMAPSEQPSNPLVQPPAPSQPNANPQQTAGIDEVTAFTLSNNLAMNFPELKDDLISGDFYKNMQATGIPLTNNGSVNLNGILSYAKIAQENKQLAAKVEELGKPNPDAIPDVNPTTPTAPADDAPMTKQIAQAILVQDPNHARAEEAKQFLQSGV